MSDGGVDDNNFRRGPANITWIIFDLLYLFGLMHMS